MKLIAVSFWVMFITECCRRFPLLSCLIGRDLEITFATIVSPEPQSNMTALRVVSNSSLDNNNSEVSNNNLLPKGPDSLVSLLEAIL